MASPPNSLFHTRLLPEGMGRRLHRIGRRFLGLLMISVGAALMACLLTYQSKDPSFNSATSFPPENALGTPGAYVADVLWQGLGFSSWVLVIGLWSWGGRMFLIPSFSPQIRHVSSLVGSGLMGAMALSGLGIHKIPYQIEGFIPPGGVVGGLFAKSLNRYAIPLWGITFMAFLVFFFLCFVAIGGSRASLISFFKQIRNLFNAVKRRKTSGASKGWIFKRIPSFLKEFLKKNRSPTPQKISPFPVSPHRTSFAQGIDPKTGEVIHAPASKEDPKEGSQRDEYQREGGEYTRASSVSSFEFLQERKEKKRPLEEQGPGDALEDFSSDSQNMYHSFLAQKNRLQPHGGNNESLFEERADNRLYEGYETPPFSFLQAPRPIEHTQERSTDLFEQYAQQLEQVLQEFGVKGEITAICPGPVVTLYELKPAPGIKTSRVIGLAEDIARSMSAHAVRIAVISGRNVIGIELPNPQRETVYLREMLESQDYLQFSGGLPLILGKNIGGDPMIADLSRMPHLLVAGTTGSGKSVSINTMILSILFQLSPERCKFIMVDPKMLELSVYDGIPHLLSPVVTDPKKAVIALKWAVKEMEDRYRSMSKLGVRNIDGYNTRLKEARQSGELLIRRVQTGFDPDTGKPIFENQSLLGDPLPYIVIVVDEMADLMLVAGKEIEAAVQRLAQMARAAGIHLIMATQRPSVDVITGTIKANFPTRISFQVTSKIDSRTILGEQGAEQLLGQGDMLYMIGGGRIVRVHGPFVKDEEVERIVQFLKQQGEPSYIEDITKEDTETESGEGADSGGGKGGDQLYQQAIELIQRERKVSTSFIQRHLQIGYNRAARMIEQMEKEGLVGPANHAGKREILR